MGVYFLHFHVVYPQQVYFSFHNIHHKSFRKLKIAVWLQDFFVKRKNPMIGCVFCFWLFLSLHDNSVHVQIYKFLYYNLLTQNISLAYGQQKLIISMIPKYNFNKAINHNRENQMIEEIKIFGKEILHSLQEEDDSFDLSLSDNENEHQMKFSDDQLPTKRKPVQYFEKVYPSNTKKSNQKKSTIFQLKNPSSLSKTVKNKIINSEYQASKSKKKTTTKESVSTSIQKNVYGRLKTQVKFRNKCPKRTYGENESKWQQFLEREKQWNSGKKSNQNSRVLQKMHPKTSVQGYISQLKTQTSRLKKTFEDYKEKQVNIEEKQKGRFSKYFRPRDSEKEELRKRKYIFN